MCLKNKTFILDKAKQLLTENRKTTKRFSFMLIHVRSPNFKPLKKKKERTQNILDFPMSIFLDFILSHHTRSFMSKGIIPTFSHT